MLSEEEHASLKVGDRIILSVYPGTYRQGESIEIIERITPTGMIRLRGSEARFSKEGLGSRQDTWTPCDELWTATPERVANVERQLLRKNTLEHIQGTKFSALSTECLLAILEAIKEDKRKETAWRVVDMLTRHYPLGVGSDAGDAEWIESYYATVRNTGYEVFFDGKEWKVKKIEKAAE